MTNLDQQIVFATAWLRKHAQATLYGEVGVRLILHAGQVARIERSVTTKEQPDKGASDA